MSTAPLNVKIYASGRISMVCQYCGRKSRPIEGPLDITTMSLGWWVAPYPAEFVHDFDGSTGARYTCPACARKPGVKRPLLTRGLD